MDAGPARQAAARFRLLGRRHTAARAGHAAPFADEGRPPGAAASVAGTSGARGATGRDGSARAADRGADLGGSDARGAAGRATS